MADSDSKLEKVQALTNEAEADIDSFNYDEAKTKLLEALQIQPENCECLEMLASVYIEQLNWDNAKDILKKCIELSPEKGYSKYFSIAQLYEGMESVRYFEKGIQLLEKQLEDSENIKPSEEQIKQRKILSRNLSDAYCAVSELYMTDCCFEESAEEKCSAAIDAALKADPTNHEYYQCLANLQVLQNKLEEAKTSLKKSLSLWLPKAENEEESDSDAENSLPVYDSRIKASKLCIELEMYKEGTKILEGLLQEDDEVTEVWFLLGFLYYSREETEYRRLAKHYFTKAKAVSRIRGEQDDDCMNHVDEMLAELNSSYPSYGESEDEDCDFNFNAGNGDDDENSSDSNEEMDI